MASQTNHDLLSTSPALLRDTDGQAIIPTTPLPGINFGAHLSGQQNLNVSDSTRRGSSYFPSQKEEIEDDKPETEAVETPQDDAEEAEEQRQPGHRRDTTQTRKNRSEDALDVSTSAALHRSRTAPLPTAPRARLIRSPSSFMQKMRRQNDNHYTSDPMYSSSESSSDDDTDDDSTEDTMKVKNAQAPRKRPQILQRSSKSRDRKNSQVCPSYSRFKIANKDFQSSGKVSKRDGRLNISIHETANNGYLAKALGQSLRHHLDLPNAKKQSKQHRYAADNAEPGKGAVECNADAVAASSQEDMPRPRLNIAIIIIGSRGDIQPFIRIGQILKNDHGHRVRLATHATFREFVEEAGLEFFSIGGNPSELMAFMVRNPGLIPSLSTIREGEVARRREAMGLMFEGMWRACTNIRDGETDEHNLKCMDHDHPFVADAVIANPPSMAPPHIVERLGIPLFMAFTFPYTPTQHFPHPLANIRPGKSNVDTSYVNFMSYPLVEMMTWQGLGDVVNRFRVNTLRLEPVSALWAPGALYRMKVPYTYMWSPGLIPKPSDWGPEIDITGFVFLDLASNFKPPDDLAKFLDAGPPPVYIGFGSIVVDDPKAFTKMIFEAAKLAGIRALVNKGWGGLGDGDDVQVPENIFMLENTPHDWLFPRVAAVVHHGGAGTTAIGLKCGKPTMIVPFFGDQPFWGAEVAKHQAGALECIPYKKLTVDTLAEGIKQCLTEEAQVNAKRLAEDINAEGDGAANAVASFHRSLPFSGPNSMRCSILEERVAVWQLKGTSLHLSALAAEILLQKRKIKRHDLKLLRHCSWNDFDGPGEPITGTVGALTDSVFDIGTGVGMVPLRVAKQLKKRQEHEQKKRKHATRKAEHRRQKDAARAAQANAELKRENAADTEKPSEEAHQASSRPSLQRERTASTQVSVISTDAPLPNAIATEFSTGFKKSAIALITMPNDLHLAIAQGFHNAPRLWGDATVRKPTRITGVKSGLVAARREFLFGVYDGFTGVVTQPIGGWRDASASRASPSPSTDSASPEKPPQSAGLARKLGGFGTGVVKGLGGLVIKNVSAIITPPAYIGKGVLVWGGKKMEGEGTKKFLRRSHFTGGFVELLDLRNAAGADAEEKEKLQKTLNKVGERWKEAGVVSKEKEKGKGASAGRPRSSSRPLSGGKEKERQRQSVRSSKEVEQPSRSSPPVRSETAPILSSTTTKKEDSNAITINNKISPDKVDDDEDPDSTTADGSGIGRQGHLDPLVPSSPPATVEHNKRSEPSHNINNENDVDDRPSSDSTLAEEEPVDEPHHDDVENDDDDDDDDKSSKSATEEGASPVSAPAPKPTTTTTTTAVKESTAPVSTDLRHVDTDEQGSFPEMMKKEDVALEGKKKHGNGSERRGGGMKKSKLPSPRAMMKGTRFGRRGEVAAV